MSSTPQLIALPEYSRKAQAWLFKHLGARNILSTLLFCFSLLLPHKSLQAMEKQPAGNKSAQAQTTEGLLATTEQMIEELIMQIALQNEGGPEKGEITENQNPTAFVTSIPNIKPLNGSVTSSFGMRLHPVFNITLFHAGIDFSAPSGTKVETTGDGIVAFSGFDRGYGQKIIINHGYGYKTIYAHLSKALVHQGERVRRGQVIALSGNSGLSTGPHLHYEVQKNSVKVNPTAYFFDEAHPETIIMTEKASVEKSVNKS